jgi:hypothetical protein
MVSSTSAIFSESASRAPGLAALRKLTQHVLVDAEKPFQGRGCYLVAHGER